MALFKVAVNLLVIMAGLQVSMGAVYKVGDSAGWTTIGNYDYKKWASSKTFHVGDIILFEYHTQYHNVIQVTHTDYQSCNVTNQIANYTSGKDSITLTKTGHYYYICGTPGHCQGGQKVDIRVVSGSSSMAPAPAPSPGLAPQSHQNSAPITSKGLFLGLVALALVTFQGFLLG